MFYHWDETEENNNGIKVLHLFIRVQTNATKDEFAEVLDERIKLRLTAQPIDGKANKHLVKLLAKIFKVPKSNIRIKKGISSRNKHLIISNPQKLPENITY